ncbi:MAG: rRNA maturation RNase YbeY [Thermoflexales bacterium]|nr:rRNA maturation RNase YbeY [Thermoflexales bacterium]
MRSASPIKISLQIEPAYRKLIERRQLRAAARLAVQRPLNLIPRPLRVSLKGEGEPALELTIVITGDDQIQALNRQYRQVDAPTDVLAFAATEAAGAQGSDAFVDASVEAVYLGDIVISYPRAEAQAQAGGHPPGAELQLLIVHGVLHLLGYEHATPAQKRAMWAVQAEIMQAIGAPITGPT